jgi:hypothetical protein
MIYIHMKRERKENLQKKKTPLLDKKSIKEKRNEKLAWIFKTK